MFLFNMLCHFIPFREFLITVLAAIVMPEGLEVLMMFWTRFEMECFETPVTIIMAFTTVCGTMLSETGEIVHDFPTY
jgi:hypothetical protein